MKKTIITLLALAFFLSFSNAQVFNTAQTLKPSTLAIGINPYYGNQFGSFFYGEYGLVSGMDLRMKIGLGNGSTYFGADIEWTMASPKPYLSITAGGHMQDDLGIDGTLNLTLPLGNTVHIYSGADMDINFGNDIEMPVWIPIGMEVSLPQNFSLILEGDIGLLNNPPNIFNGGINFYF